MIMTIEHTVHAGAENWDHAEDDTELLGLA